MMPRPIEFNRQRALEAAMKLFWIQGYTATSTAQLLEAMQIGRSSLYAVFGDKRSLFVECLVLFGDRTKARLVNAGRTPKPQDAVRAFFESTLFETPESRMRRGCMMVNSVLELADVDNGLCQLAANKLAEIQAVFEAIFAAAMQEGSFRSDRSPAELASFVMTINQGLRVACRKNTSRAELSAILETTLSLLGLDS